MAKRITRDFSSARLACASAIITALSVLVGQVSAGTKTVNYGWEDGAGTVVGGQVRDGGAGGQLIATNVSTGNELDYGPSDTPFDPALEYTVNPFAGNRMLQVELNPLNLAGGPEAKAYLGYVQNLDDGDVIEYRMRAFDPSDGRSPSVTIWATYAENGDVDTAEGSPNFISFGSFYGGTGWLDMIADTNGDIPAADPTLDFITGGDPLRQAVVLTADLWAPSLADPNNGSGLGQGRYRFFIDDMVITVTSDNPAASITLPNGSVVLVNAAGSPADFDGDGDVDGDDFLIWQSAFLVNANGDADGDGDTDGDDFLIWQSSFGTSTGSAANAVPEPASAMLLVVAGCLALLAWKRK